MTPRRRTTCVPFAGGLIRGSFTDEEIAAYRAAAREAAGTSPALSDPPATVPGSVPPLGEETMTNPLNIENAPETGGDKWTNADHEGELIVLTVKGTGKDTFDNGEAEYLVADITVVEGPSAGESFEDSWVFGRVLFGQLKRKIGRTFVGRIVKGQGQKGKNPPWQLDPVSPEETQRAVAYMTERLTPPPASSGGAPAEGPAPTEVGDSDAPPWARR